ncbi:hypothetical protein ACFWFI_23895 [Streptomyces sp. NPDC060209]|uniref:hypothetical protein n=1 Tax=Streptomyces sp. NPDC060209 TaxID=3347073 RepID=UPI00365AB22F
MIIAVPVRSACVFACVYLAAGLLSDPYRPAGCHATVTVDEIVDNMPDEKVSGIITDAAARSARPWVRPDEVRKAEG